MINNHWHDSSLFQRLTWISRALRWPEWRESKMPILFVPALYLAIITPKSDSATIGAFFSAMLFCGFFLAFGYAANDLADYDDDRRAGKPNVFGELPAWASYGVLLLLAAIGLLSVLPYLGQTGVALLVALTYLAGITYSFPPRFKERGWLGLFSASTAQRSFPALVIFAIFNDLDGLAMVFALLGGLTGLRWILIHQVLDLEHDRQTGVETWTTAHQNSSAERLLRNWVFPAEMTALLIVALLMCLQEPAITAIFAGYLCWLMVWRRVWSGAGKEMWSFAGYGRQPFADFYHCIWPLGLALLLVVERPRMLPVGLVVLFWVLPYLRGRVALFRRLSELGRAMSGARSAKSNGNRTTSNE